MSEKKLKAVVLGAGKGTRLKSETAGIPKVMRLANGKPLLGHVLERLSFIDSQNIILVVGYKKEAIINTYPGYKFAEQTEQLGTGHAVAAAKDLLEGFTGDVLVCCGDMPLIKKRTYSSLIEMHRNGNYACTILAGEQKEKMSYGRIVRDTNGMFVKIVEQKDCNEQEDEIREYNSGVYIFDCTCLLKGLKSLNNKNAQSEYYITDVPGILSDRGDKVGICTLQLGDELIGVNTNEQLEQVERLLERK